MSSKEFEIAGKSWRVTSNGRGKIVNVCVALTKAEYLALRKKLPDPYSTFENTSCVNLFKNGLARARFLETFHILAVKDKEGAEDSRNKAADMDGFLVLLDDGLIHDLSQLDQSINAHFIDPSQKIKALQTQLIAYQNTLSSLPLKMELFLKTSHLTPLQKQFIQEDFDQLVRTLSTSTRRFQTQLETLSELPSSAHELELLLSPQARGDLLSLGDFLAEQSTAASMAAEKITATIHDRYLMDLIIKNPITSAFISAKSHIRQKNSTLAGVEFTDMYKQAAIVGDLPEQGFFSVMPYLEDATPASLDKLICLISDIPLNQRSLSIANHNPNERLTYLASRPFKALLNFIVAPLTELLILTPIRLVLFPLLAIFRPISPDSIDMVAAVLANFSLVPIAKIIWNEQYKRFDKEGNPIVGHHQDVLNAYKNNNSIFVDFFKERYTPASITKATIEAGNTIVSVFQQAGSVIARGRNWYQSTPREIEDPQVVFEKYENSYDLLKLVMDKLADASKSTKTINNRFPDPIHNRVEDISSPNKIICEIMHVLNEDICRHLIETMPGPSVAYFVLSVGTFGLNFVPSSSLLWMHSIPKYLQLLANTISKATMGEKATESISQGILAAYMEWQIAMTATQLMLVANEKDNTIAEKIAQNPEEILTAILLFSALGYAIGYLPTIAPIMTAIPGIGQLNIYGTLINMITSAAKKAREGVLGANVITYFAIGIKCALLVQSELVAGEETYTNVQLEALIQQCADAQVFEEHDMATRKSQVTEIIRSIGITDIKTIALMIEAVEGAFLDHDTLKEKLEQKLVALHGSIETNQRLIDQVLTNIPASNTRTPLEKLEKAIRMQSDPPMVFPVGARDDAIAFYNRLDGLFDEYNDSEVGKRCMIDKENYLRAFRNKHCQQTGFIGYLVRAPVIRLLSFFPGNFPIAFRDTIREAYLGRLILPLPWPIPQVEIAKLSFQPAAFVRDTIAASKGKDSVLWHQWPAILRNTSATLGVYGIKILRATLAVLGAVFVVPTSLILKIVTPKAPSANMTFSFQRLGRFLERLIPIDIQDGFDSYALKQRRYVAAAVHRASSYDDLIESSEIVLDRITLAKNSCVAKPLEFFSIQKEIDNASLDSVNQPARHPGNRVQVVSGKLDEGSEKKEKSPPVPQTPRISNLTQHSIFISPQLNEPKSEPKKGRSLSPSIFDDTQ